MKRARARATVARCDAVQVDAERLLDLTDDLHDLAARIRASARVVVILDQLSARDQPHDLAYHRACMDVLGKL